MDESKLNYSEAVRELSKKMEKYSAAVSEMRETTKQIVSIVNEAEAELEKIAKEQ